MRVKSTPLAGGTFGLMQWDRVGLRALGYVNGYVVEDGAGCAADGPQ